MWEPTVKQYNKVKQTLDRNPLCSQFDLQSNTNEWIYVSSRGKIDEKYKVSAKKNNTVSSVLSFMDTNEIISNLTAES